MDSALAKRFGAVLKHSRKALGISQETLAFNAGLHRTYISLLERGVRQPSLETIFLLATAMSLEPSELIHRVQKQ